MRVVFISDLNATRYTANMEKKMLGKNTGSMTFKETNNPIDSGKFGCLQWKLAYLVEENC